MNKLIEYLNTWVQEHSCSSNFYIAICNRLEQLSDKDIKEIIS